MWRAALGLEQVLRERRIQTPWSLHGLRSIHARSVALASLLPPSCGHVAAQIVGGPGSTTLRDQEVAARVLPQEGCEAGATRLRAKTAGVRVVVVRAAVEEAELAGIKAPKKL